MSLESFLTEMALKPSIILKIPKFDENGSLVGFNDLPLTVTDDSYRNREIMGEHNLYLKFSLPGYYDIPIGSYCEYQYEMYTLETSASITKNGEEKFDYTLLLQSEQYKLSKFIIRNTIPGDSRLKFSYTARPEEFLRLLADNMNKRDEGWSFGSDHIEAYEKTVSFNMNSCAEALKMIAEAFETEWEVIGKTIYLRKVEYMKDDPLPLSYGKGKGFLPGIGRTEYSDVKPLQRLFVQGGERNIDSSKYRKTEATGQVGSRELLMPANAAIKFDGIYFDDEEGFNPQSANLREFITDESGASIINATNKNIQGLIEGTLDCSGIYPMREGTVTRVVSIDSEKNLYDFYDSDASIPNYTDYLIAGETMTVIFQTGMLTGKEFEVIYKHPGHFEIVPQTIDGVDMPGGAYMPEAGDRYGVFHVMLPDEYIASAERAMLKQAVKYLYENEQPKFTFSGTLDKKWAKENWINAGIYMRPGAFIRFSDNQFLKDGMDIRITGIKDYINNPYKPEIRLSNNSQSGSWLHNMKRQVESDEVTTDTKDREVRQFAKRRFRDTQQAIDMLNAAMLEGFSEGISPATIKTMMMFLGSQFRFVVSEDNPIPVHHQVDVGTDMITVDAGVIQCVDAIGNSAGEYRYWTLPQALFAPASEASYYLYAKVNSIGTTGEFIISEDAISKDALQGYYHFLVGLINSVYDGERGYTPLVGWTEVLPGQVVTDVLRSQDGRTYFDLLGNEIRLNDPADGATTGMTGTGTGDGSLRIWVNAPNDNRDDAAFRVYRDGKAVMKNAILHGSIALKPIHITQENFEDYFVVDEYGVVLTVGEDTGYNFTINYFDGDTWGDGIQFPQGDHTHEDYKKYEGVEIGIFNNTQSDIRMRGYFTNTYPTVLRAGLLKPNCYMRFICVFNRDIIGPAYVWKCIIGDHE